MISRVHSSILQGIDAIGCEVEADVSGGQEGTVKLVGLAEKSVQESVSRIQAALRNSGYRWAGPKVTINLAPADVKKDSAVLSTLGQGHRGQAARERGAGGRSHLRAFRAALRLPRGAGLPVAPAPWSAM